ncbi:hypothetical protein D0B54_03800 [Solimonas sp. K1W22B-7]|uniref:hypothetical protein n=1 Tax=Solimonas sp. K1W22B-7 TaxID=2303331 RepID=UPI000E337018|nr:hypothetical protein [Solimonas sp. K1W22B-7]AXQ27853.1 hypothetical protein D0B54_03800 [Solimonas sp. K1W22B-7]
MDRIVFRRVGCGVLAALLLPLAAAAAPGAPQGPPFRLDTPGLVQRVGQVDVAGMASGRFVAAWRGENNVQSAGDGIYLRRFDAAGAPLEADDHVEGSAGNAHSPAVASNDSGAYAVAWAETKNFGYEDIYVRAYDAAGQPRGPALQVNEEASYRIRNIEPAVAMAANGDFIVVWLRQDPEVVNGSLVFLFSFDYYWIQSSAIVAQRFSANGTPLGKAQRVATGVRSEFPLLLDPGNGPGLGLGRTLSNPSVAMHDDGRTLVAWASKSYDYQSYKQDTELRMQRYSAAGKEQGLSSILVYKSLAIDSTAVDMDAAGNAVVAWSAGPVQYSWERDVMLRRYDAAGKARSAAVLAHVDSARIQEHVDVAVAPGGSFVLGWENSTKTPGGDVISKRVEARRFGADGNPLAAEFVVADPAYGIRAAVDALGNPLLVWGAGGLWGRVFEGP